MGEKVRGRGEEGTHDLMSSEVVLMYFFNVCVSVCLFVCLFVFTLWLLFILEGTHDLTSSEAGSSLQMNRTQIKSEPDCYYNLLLLLKLFAF